MSKSEYDKTFDKVYTKPKIVQDAFRKLCSRGNAFDTNTMKPTELCKELLRTDYTPIYNLLGFLGKWLMIILSIVIVSMLILK